MLVLEIETSCDETAAAVVRVGRDIVAFHIHDGPTLYLHPENALALLKGQALPEQRDAGMPDASLADGEVMLPPRLQCRRQA